MELGPERRSCLPFIIMALVVLLCGWAAYEGYGLYKISMLNALIKHPETIKDDRSYPVEVMFAKAWYLEKQGKPMEALEVYSEISRDSNPKIRENALYNMGTIYLSQGAREWKKKGTWASSEILTRVELAEQSYREVLALNPQNRSARYNLEYVLRIYPPSKGLETADGQSVKSSVEAVLPDQSSDEPKIRTK